VANNDVKYDAIYPELAVVGKVAHENLAGIQWASKFAPPDGDGLLIVSKREDPHAGAVIYLSRGRVETAVPSNYQNVVIQ
jgi:hypothetical protein